MISLSPKSPPQLSDRDQPKIQKKENPNTAFGSRENKGKNPTFFFPRLGKLASCLKLKSEF